MKSKFFYYISIALILPLSLFAENNKNIFKCALPQDITREDVSVGKFRYIMNIPNKNIKFTSNPIYKWVDNHAVSFVKDTINYSSNQDIINCIYKTNALGGDKKAGLNEISEIDLQYKYSDRYNYKPQNIELWRKINSSKLECDESIEDCEIKSES